MYNHFDVSHEKICWEIFEILNFIDFDLSYPAVDKSKPTQTAFNFTINDVK